MRTLLDLRFADDILLLAKTFDETIFLLDELVACFAEVGLQFNVGKTKILTTQSQSPSEVPLRKGKVIDVLDHGSPHTWLECLLCTANTGNHTSDLAHYLQAASSAFYAYRLFLIKNNVARRDHCKFFFVPLRTFSRNRLWFRLFSWAVPPWTRVRNRTYISHIRINIQKILNGPFPAHICHTGNMESSFGCSETLSEKRCDAAPEPRIACNMEQSITRMRVNR